MSAEALIGIAGAVIIALTFAAIVYKKAPKRVKRTKYTKKWRDIQQL